MFRPLFRSLFASRPQARTRPHVSFQPQLEALEHRLAPGNIIQQQVNAPYNTEIAIGTNILQKQINTGLNGTEIALGTNIKEIQANNGPTVQTTAIGTNITLVAADDSYTTVIGIGTGAPVKGVVTGQSGGIEIFT